VQLNYHPFSTKPQTVLHYQPEGTQFRDGVSWQYDTSLKDGHALDGQLAVTVRGTPKKTTLFSGHYIRNRSTLVIGVLGYIVIF
jgi:hypothetical protein